MRKGVSAGVKPKVIDRRYLRPDEANRLVDAAGRRGRYPFRDKVLLRLVYRHGLRASEACGLRWSQIDVEQGVIHVKRVKGSLETCLAADAARLASVVVLQCFAPSKNPQKRPRKNLIGPRSHCRFDPKFNPPYRHAPLCHFGGGGSAPRGGGVAAVSSSAPRLAFGHKKTPQGLGAEQRLWCWLKLRQN
jgi:Phage integrase family